MNYIIEDDFDFFKELNDTSPNVHVHNQAQNQVVTSTDNSSSETTYTNRCMISHLPLTHNSVTLVCKHSFNYLSLYKELCLHNNKKNIVCPYCRDVSDKFIPYIPLPNVVKINGVNYPLNKCMPAPKCSFILKSGKHKDQACGMNGIECDKGIFCIKHKTVQENVWTPEMDKLFKSYNLIELKKQLRTKKLPVGGNKKDLVRRLVGSLVIINK